MDGMRWLAALLVAVAPAPVGAQEASFDCLKAQAPIEQLVCSDPELLALDGAVGQAFLAARQRLPTAQRPQALAEQRAWLGERLVRCGVPAAGREVPLELRWQAAPCLEEMYRARLTALGVQPEPRPPAPARAQEPGFIHPACLWPLVDQPAEVTEEPPPVPLAACNRGNRHIPVGETEDGGFTAQGASDGYFTWLTYRPVGTLPDGRSAVIIWYNSGGTGVFSEITLLRRQRSADGGDILLTGELLAGGGDRCNGGIKDARLQSNGTVQVDYEVTPQDLLSETDEHLATANIDELAVCATCCTGTLRRSVDVVTRKEQTVSATIVQLAGEQAEGEEEPVQACFDGLVRGMGGTLPHTFDVAGLQRLSRAFAEQCGRR